MTPDFINQSICLSRIPKDKIKEDPNTGEKWVNVTCAKMKNADNYGNTHTVYAAQGRDEKKEDRVYVGRGKEFFFKEQVPSPESVENMPTASSTDDLLY